VIRTSNSPSIISKHTPAKLPVKVKANANVLDRALAHAVDAPVYEHPPSPEARNPADERPANPDADTPRMKGKRKKKMEANTADEDHAVLVLEDDVAEAEARAEEAEVDDVQEVEAGAHEAEGDDPEAEIVREPDIDVVEAEAEVEGEKHKKHENREKLERLENLDVDLDEDLEKPQRKKKIK